jgi:hypothetical protein
MEQLKILTARRAYEFRPDDLRLSVLSVVQVHQQIQQLFSFQVAAVGTPQQTFGPVPNTMPPGLVLDFGATQTPENIPTPMRFLHFEPQRIVIDVAGPSSAIDWTYEQLQRVLTAMQAPDGSPVLGEPERVREYSEISVHLGFGFEKLVGGPVFELAQKTFAEDHREVLPMGVKFDAVDPDNKVEPGRIGLHSYSRGNSIELRAGTRPEDKVFLSVAELPTDQHIAWLESLEREVNKM